MSTRTKDSQAVLPRTGRGGRIAAVGLAGTLALIGGLVAPAAAQASTNVARSTAGGASGTLPPLDPAALQAALSGPPNADITGALAEVSDVRTSGRWQGVSGLGDVETGRAASPGDRFRIGSVTKLFTATVTLQLVASHRVSLSAPIQDYLPGELPGGYPPITVAELLNHTSGLPGVHPGTAQQYNGVN